MVIPDMGSIAAAIGSLKTAAEIAKGFLDLKEAAAVQGRVIELQGVILAAQSSALAAQSDQMTLLQDIRELKEKAAQLEAWDAEKKRYQLKDYGGGTFAYELKKEEAGSEPVHRICPNCYEQRHRSVLQTQGQNHRMQDLCLCPSCKTEFALGFPRERPLPRVNRDYDPFR